LLLIWATCIHKNSSTKLQIFSQYLQVTNPSWYHLLLLIQTRPSSSTHNIVFTNCKFHIVTTFSYLLLLLLQFLVELLLNSIFSLNWYFVFQFRFCLMLCCEFWFLLNVWFCLLLCFRFLFNFDSCWMLILLDVVFSYKFDLVLYVVLWFFNSTIIRFCVKGLTKGNCSWWNVNVVTIDCLIFRVIDWLNMNIIWLYQCNHECLKDLIKHHQRETELD